MTGDQVAIAVPAGTSHDIWTDGNTVPQLKQAINDTDFELEVKFESPVLARFQQQGILVEGGADNMVRLEIQHDGQGPRLLAVTFQDGAPTTRLSSPVALGSTQYLRVTRVGDYWALTYSSDGTSWNVAASFEYPLAPTSAGVYAGNALGTQAHTAIVDYYFNTASPVVPEDGGAP
jgi:hypothetical protein